MKTRPRYPRASDHEGQLPKGVATVLRKIQTDLSPLESRQLDTLLRKRMGVADPNPATLEGASNDVCELAARIGRAAVAADIQRLQKRGPTLHLVEWGGPK